MSSVRRWDAPGVGVGMEQGMVSSIGRGRTDGWSRGIEMARLCAKPGVMCPPNPSDGGQRWRLVGRDDFPCNSEELDSLHGRMSAAFRYTPPVSIFLCISECVYIRFIRKKQHTYMCIIECTCTCMYVSKHLGVRV